MSRNWCGDVITSDDDDVILSGIVVMSHVTRGSIANCLNIYALKLASVYFILDTISLLIPIFISSLSI